MTGEKLKHLLEAVLMVANEPLSVDRFTRLFDPKLEAVPTRDQIRQALAELSEDYQNRGIELKEVASGFRIQVREAFCEWVNRVWEEKSPRYSRALLETVAIIAYRQPITRGEIENIRGVSVSTGIIRTLMDREWIRVAGHRDVPGRPAVYSTTREFLDYFNLKSLSDLPALAELRDIDDINPDLFAGYDTRQPQQEPADPAAEEEEPDAARPRIVLHQPHAPEASNELNAERAEVLQPLSGRAAG